MLNHFGILNFVFLFHPFLSFFLRSLLYHLFSFFAWFLTISNLVYSSQTQILLSPFSPFLMFFFFFFHMQNNSIQICQIISWLLMFKKKKLNSKKARHYYSCEITSETKLSFFPFSLFFLMFFVLTLFSFLLDFSQLAIMYKTAKHVPAYLIWGNHHLKNK